MAMELGFHDEEVPPLYASMLNDHNDEVLEYYKTLIIAVLDKRGMSKREAVAKPWTEPPPGQVNPPPGQVNPPPRPTTTTADQQQIEK
ncbi:hypothetical protein TrST_g479 [Triparma strigata]|uniref:Uncharacterized protein n=1 Tax=Triparma strigata TaxID=1606541 RepID=A0A9W7BSR5_9STRA|nr:hypothetical protein TrST_g479 [Triparma strigata]